MLSCCMLSCCMLSCCMHGSSSASGGVALHCARVCMLQ
jgi:hypothetical protein